VSSVDISVHTYVHGNIYTSVYVHV
jgi:hypothetical protein